MNTTMEKRPDGRPLQSWLSIPQGFLVIEVGGEAVLLNLKSERYYGLDEVATRMWQVITTAASLEAAREILMAEYDVEEDKLREDMSALVGKLIAEGLLEQNKAYAARSSRTIDK